MIQINHITKIFPHDGRKEFLRVFSDFSCSFEKGMITAILGASGSGKSTLGRIISGLETRYEGEVLIRGLYLDSYLKEKRIGVVPQRFANFEWMNVYDNITLGKQDPEYAEKIMERLGLTTYRNFYPKELSGGLQQRVALARALFYKSEVIVFDEPFGGLDEDTRMRVLEFIQPILKELKITGIFITHKIEEALYLADRVLVFSDKPVSIIRDLKVPDIVRDRNFYFDKTMLDLKKSLLQDLMQDSESEIKV